MRHTDTERAALVAARYYGKRNGDGWAHWATLGTVEALNALVESGHLEVRMVHGTGDRPVVQYRIKPKETKTDD